MSGIQKIIKYCALAFAFSLIVLIISSILLGINSLSNAFISNDNKENTDNKDVVDLNVPVLNIYELDIDLKASNLTIKEGNNLKAETTNKNIKVTQKGNTLTIKEKNNSLLKNNGGNLTIHVPKDYIFNKVDIEMGAGNLDIFDLTSRELELDLGAGKSVINNLNVLNNATLDGGVGSIDINGGVINNLKLEVGVGSVNLSSIIKGSSYIDSGIGKLNLNILDSFSNYRVSLDKGIGSAKLNGNNMEDNIVYGTGYNIININGGIGSIFVNFNN